MVDARITRAGIFLYQNADGSIRRELRSRKEVFDADSMRSFQQLPVTNTHPYEQVSAKNARQYMVGMNGEAVVRDEDYLRTPIAVVDAQTIAEMDADQKVQLSCGYTCDYIAEPGVDPEWGRYDGRQTKIRGNHIALVTHARAGELARVRMDGAPVLRADYAVMATSGAVLTSIVDGHQHSFDPQTIRDGIGSTSWSTSNGSPQGHSHDVVRNADGTFTVGMNDGHTHTLLGLTTEVEGTKTDAKNAPPMKPPVARAKEIVMPPIKNQLTLDAATAELAKETLRADALVIELATTKASLTEAVARADAAEGALSVAREKLEESNVGRIDQARLDVEIAKVADLTAKLAAEKSRADAALDPITRSREVQERARVERAVHSVIGEDFKCDGLSNRELQIEVIKKLGKAPEATESDASIRARFDERVSNFDASEAAVARVRQAAAGAQSEQQRRADTAEDVRKRTEEERRNGWQKPPLHAPKQ